MKTVVKANLDISKCRGILRAKGFEVIYSKTETYASRNDMIISNDKGTWIAQEVDRETGIVGKEVCRSLFLMTLLKSVR